MQRVGVEMGDRGGVTWLTVVGMEVMRVAFRVYFESWSHSVVC